MRVTWNTEHTVKSHHPQIFDDMIFRPYVFMLSSLDVLNPHRSSSQLFQRTMYDFLPSLALTPKDVSLFLCFLQKWLTPYSRPLIYLKTPKSPFCPLLPGSLIAGTWLMEWVLDRQKSSLNYLSELSHPGELEQTASWCAIITMSVVTGRTCELVLVGHAR